MAKFAKNVDPQAVAERQAANIMKQVQGNILSSVGTVRNYEERLTIVAKHANAEFKCGLRDLTVERAHQYLTDRAVKVGQKTLDMDRQAIQCMMQNVSGKLSATEKLDVIKSEHQQILSSRSYTAEQAKMVSDAQTERNALATEIAHAAGLRAHELHTLQRLDERTPDPRPALEEKFSGREGERYTVEGKGGLIREVFIPKHLSDRLEERRFELAYEMKRWYDIARRKLGATAFGPNGLESEVSTEQNVGPGPKSFDPAKDYLFPIPLDEIVRNPNLTQNPKY